MKNIGITSRIINDNKHGEIRDTIDQRWIGYLAYTGFNPIIIPTGVNYSNFIKNLNIEGIIFSGGDNLFSISNNNISQIRDKKEKIILQHALNETIPIYGVCRGMQFIAEYFGSTLKKVKNHVGRKHKVFLNKKFWGTSFLKNKTSVNSYHEFGIDRLGNNLINVVISEDENIEAFIHSKLRIFCQMWHPEREKPYSVSDVKLINKFFND